MAPIRRWIRGRQRLVRPVAALSLLFGGVTALTVASAAPALAASTLCSGFTQCTTTPYTDHGYNANRYTSYWGQDASTGDNCTNYVAYYEQAVRGRSATRPSWLGTGGAKVWWDDAGSGGVAESQTPVVGAVAWWGGFDWNGGDGHVGIVEKVLNNGDTIEVSWDSYPSGPYKWVSLNSTDANTDEAVGWPQGFIYLGGVGNVGTGGSGNSKVPGNWIGNGVTDFSVFRPGDGTWHYYYTGTGGPDISQQFGLSGDIPVPGYYFGSTQLDWAVYRPSNQTWYIMNQATKSTITQSFGLPGAGSDARPG